MRETDKAKAINDQRKSPTDPEECKIRALARELSPLAGDLRGSVLHCCARLSRACNGRLANLLKLQGFLFGLRTLTPLVKVRILVPQPTRMPRRI